MTTVFLAGMMAIIFAIIAISEPISSKIKIPHALLLSIVGILIALTSGIIDKFKSVDFFPEEIIAVFNIDIPSSLFLGFFLPILIFQVALSVDARRMMEDWIPIMVMAIFAVILSTAMVGFAISPFLEISIYACLLIGAIVSTTDPGSVLDVFKNISAPPRLTRIIQGESLLNDATAIALFTFFLAFVRSGTPNPDLQSVLVDVPKVMIGGALIGWVSAFLIIPLISMMKSWPISQMSMSISLAFVSFISANHFGMSGVIAAFTSGIMLNLSSGTKISPFSMDKMKSAWEIIASWSGSLIFLLAAVSIPEVLKAADFMDVFVVFVVFVSAIASRSIILWAILPILEKAGLSPQIDSRYRVVILWGGLRGAITLALALSVVESALIPISVKEKVGVIAAGYVFLTLSLQGMTLAKLIHGLGLDRFSKIERAIRGQAISLALSNMSEVLRDRLSDTQISDHVIEMEEATIRDHMVKSLSSFVPFSEISEKDKIRAALVAICGHEQEIIIAAYRDGIISPSIRGSLIRDTQERAELTRQKGRYGYMSSSRSGFFRKSDFKIASLLARIGFTNILRDIEKEFHETLVAQKFFISDLRSSVSSKISRIYGERIAEIICEVLEKREEAISEKIASIFEGATVRAEAIEAAWARRLSLRLEELEYRKLLEENMIPESIFEDLMQDIKRRRRDAELLSAR